MINKIQTNNVLPITPRLHAGKALGTPVTQGQTKGRRDIICRTQSPVDKVVCFANVTANVSQSLLAVLIVYGGIQAYGLVDGPICRQAGAGHVAGVGLDSRDQGMAEVEG